MEYSGIVGDGWTEAGTYDRLQFAGELTSLPEMTDFIEHALIRFNDSGRSRMDLRLRFNGERHILESLQTLFPHLEISAFFEPDSTFNTTNEILVCLNKKERDIGNPAVQFIQGATRDRLTRLYNNDVEMYGMTALKEVVNSGYTFGVNNFTADELYAMWSDSFGWTREQCELYEKGSREDEKIYGMRDPDGNVSALVLISHGESTEWAVSPDKQGHGLISPLLMMSHADWVNNNPERILQVFARFNRSVSPATRTGFEHFVSNGRYALENHVTVSTDETPDLWNVEKNSFGDIDGTKLRSFVLGQLDHKLITQKLRDSYLPHI